MVNSDKSDAEIFKIAYSCFSEHIERSVKYGGRSAQSVINDYLINPHYIGISTNTLLSWADKYHLEFYSAWPQIELPFLVDSAYFKLISKTSSIYRNYISLLRLRWLYTQDEDANVFAELLSDLPQFAEPIERMIEKLNTILQERDYSEAAFSQFISHLNDMKDVVNKTMITICEYVNSNLERLNKELARIVAQIVGKARANKNFDLENLSNELFRGYNGLGTSYVIFHKIDES